MIIDTQITRLSNRVANAHPDSTDPAYLMLSDNFEIDDVDTAEVSKHHEKSKLEYDNKNALPFDYLVLALNEYHLGLPRVAQKYLREWIATGEDTVIARLYYCDTLENSNANNRRKYELLEPVLDNKGEHSEVYYRLAYHTLNYLVTEGDVIGLSKLEDQIDIFCDGSPLHAVAKLLLLYSREYTLAECGAQVAEMIAKGVPEYYLPKHQTIKLTNGIQSWLKNGYQQLANYGDRENDWPAHVSGQGETLKRLIAKGRFCGVDIPDIELAILFYTGKFPRVASKTVYSKLESQLYELDPGIRGTGIALWFAVNQNMPVSQWIARLQSFSEQENFNRVLSYSIGGRLNNQAFLLRLVKRIMTTNDLDCVIPMLPEIFRTFRDKLDSITLKQAEKAEFALKWYRITQDLDALNIASYCSEPEISIPLYIELSEKAEDDRTRDFANKNLRISLLNCGRYQEAELVESRIKNKEFQLNADRKQDLKDRAAMQVNKLKFFEPAPKLSEIPFRSFYLYFFGNIITSINNRGFDSFSYRDFIEYFGFTVGERVLEALLTNKVVRPESFEAIHIDADTAKVNLIHGKESSYSLNIKEFIDLQIPFGTIGETFIQQYIDEVGEAGSDKYMEDMQPVLLSNLLEYTLELDEHFKINSELGSKLNSTLEILVKYLPSTEAYRIMFLKAQDAAGNIRSGKSPKHAINIMLKQIRWHTFSAITEGWVIRPLDRHEIGKSEPTSVSQVERDLLKLNVRRDLREAVTLEELELNS